MLPTPLGEVTTKLMVDSFPDIVDYQFTADVENDLDNIEKGNRELNMVLKDFWKGFSLELAEAEKQIDKIKTLSVAPMFAEAMIRVFTNTSLNGLF